MDEKNSSHIDVQSKTASEEAASSPASEIDATLETIKNLMYSALQAYSEEKTLQAAKLITQAEDELKKKILEENEKSKEIIELIGSTRAYASMKSEANEVQDLIDHMEEEEGWRLIRDSDNTKTYYRREDGLPLHSIKAESTFNCSIFNIIAILNEMDLYHSWVPFLTTSFRCAQLSWTRQLGYVAFKFPWPVHNRDCSVLGYGVDDLEANNRVIIFCKRQDTYDGLTFSDPALQETKIPVPDPPNGTVRVGLPKAGFVLWPEGPNKTRVCIVANADPKLAFIPSFLINFATHQLAHFAVTKLRDRAEAMSDETIAERIRSDSHGTYAFLKCKMKKYFPEED